MTLTQDDYNAIAAAIAEVMAQIRSDVEAGVGSLIEADAVAIGIADGIANYIQKIDPTFDRQAFLEAADVVDLIPSEAFHN